jgi:hypothetical protein
MLTTDERIQVIDELSDYAAPPNSIGVLVRSVFSIPADRTELGQLPLDLVTVTDQASWLVDACLSSRWRRSPSLLELLLTRLVNTAGKGALAPLLTRVQQKIDPNPDPFATFWVLAQQPFLSRPQLRNAARDLIDGVNQPILRVNGPGKSGKTYTTQLFSFVMAEARPDLHVVPVELADGTGPTYKVEELAESLTLTMESTDPLPQRSTSSYPKALARWLVRNVNRNPGLWIFVLDGFGQKNVQDEVIEFINLLAQYVFSPEFSRKMRLVLLHFDKDLIGNWRAWTADDGPLPLNGVTANDLIDCINAFNALMQAQNQPQRMIEASEIPVLANAMLANAQTAPFQLPSLYEQLRTIVTS